MIVPVQRTEYQSKGMPRPGELSVHANETGRSAERGIVEVLGTQTAHGSSAVHCGELGAWNDDVVHRKTPRSRRKANAPAADLGANAIENAGWLRDGRAVSAESGLRGVGPYHDDGTDVLRERQQAAAILQQYDRRPRRVCRERTMSCIRRPIRRAVRVDERMLEQPKLELRA